MNCTKNPIKEHIETRQRGCRIPKLVLHRHYASYHGYTPMANPHLIGFTIYNLLTKVQPKIIRDSKVDTNTSMRLMMGTHFFFSSTTF
uniref:Putative ovule protein n=1 Tax=Solanum chacoense TaxID=4108 RepID=A0A0V0IEC3_SOLCH